MFHLRFGLSDHLKALLDFVFGSRRRVKKVRIFRAWFSQWRQVLQSQEEVIIFLGDDGCRGSLESHISPRVLLGRTNRVRMWDECGRSSGSGGSGRCGLNGPNFFGPRRSKAESRKEEPWRKRDLVGPHNSCHWSVQSIGYRT